MDADLHQGVVAFQPLARGREAVMLGRVLVGEIMPTGGGPHTVCFRLALPDVSSSSWSPARDASAARNIILHRINDWLNAAGLRPVRAR